MSNDLSVVSSLPDENHSLLRDKQNTHELKDAHWNSLSRCRVRYNNDKNVQ